MKVKRVSLDKSFKGHIIKVTLINALTGTSKWSIPDREKRSSVENRFQESPLKTTRERETERFQRELSASKWNGLLR